MLQQAMLSPAANGRATPRARRARRPVFFWQGALIVLPALLLGSLGLVLLRQDRLLAEREAVEEARQVAGQLTRGPLRKALEGLVPTSESVARFHTAPTQAEQDPLRLCSSRQQAFVLCLLDPQGGLAYPPPLASLPVPQPLEEDQLQPSLRSDWQAFSASLPATNDLASAIAAGERFLIQSPPARFAAVTRYRLGVLCCARGTFDQARNWFERVLSEDKALAAESGHLLRTYAQLQLLQLPAAAGLPTTRKVELLEALGQAAVLEPSVLSRFILHRFQDVITNPISPVVSWQQTWQIHETARRLYESFQAAALLEPPGTPPAPGSRWLPAEDAGESETQDRLALLLTGGGELWLIALPAAQILTIVKEALAATLLPAYLGLSVELAGHPVVAVGGNGEILATSTLSLSGQNGASDLKLTVRLVAPDKLYQRQRARTRWFGLLIGMSVATVLIGFAAAWRAYRREQQLSEMRSSFVASVSHELRAPIAAIRLMSEELEALAAGDPAKAGEYHRFIHQECRRLSALIENVLDFSRNDQGRKQYEFEPTDLVALVEETVRRMQPYATDKRVRLLSQVRGQPVEVQADGAAIQRVLVNLLDNAIKHSPEAATVSVSLDFGTEANRSVALHVEDHGQGIPVEDHQRIFERFYRRGSELRRETQGIGLGLTIVKYITEAHGGQVSLRSAPGQGARFTVRLPLASNHPDKP